jgi:hypothetical protein
MDGDEPGIDRKKDAGKGTNPTRRKNKNNAKPPVTDSAESRKRVELGSIGKALDPASWESIRWQALTEKGDTGANN